MTKWQVLGVASLLLMCCAIAVAVYEAMEQRWASVGINLGAAFAFHVFSTWVLRKHEAQVRRVRRQDKKWGSE
jgi:hypothetical protein